MADIDFAGPVRCGFAFADIADGVAVDQELGC